MTHVPSHSEEHTQPQRPSAGAEDTTAEVRWQRAGDDVLVVTAWAEHQLTGRPFASVIWEAVSQQCHVVLDLRQLQRLTAPALALLVGMRMRLLLDDRALVVVEPGTDPAHSTRDRSSDQVALLSRKVTTCASVEAALETLRRAEPER